MVKYKNLQVWYPNKIYSKNIILEESSFSIEKNKVTGLTGLNGSGKSTLMKAITGLNLHATGSLFLDGDKKDSHILSNYLKVGYSPEISDIPFKGSLKDLLKIYHILNGNNQSEALPKLIENVIEDFDLSKYLNQTFNKLSKGTKKRVLILIGLLGDPKFIILDEPLEGLDIDQRKRIKQIISELKRDRYILISSHEILELENICDDFLHIEDQRVTKIE